MTNDERLVAIEVKLDELKEQFINHLIDHKKYMYMAWSTAVGLIITLIILILKFV